MEYKDNWQTFIGYHYRDNCAGNIFNGFKDFIDLQRTNKDFFANDSLYAVKESYKYYIRVEEDQPNESTLIKYYPFNSIFGSTSSIYKQNSDLTYTLVTNKDSEAGLYKTKYTRTKLYSPNSSIISTNSYLEKLNSDRSACSNFETGTSINLTITEKIVNECLIISSKINLFNTSNDLCPSFCGYSLTFPKGITFRDIKSFSDYEFFKNGKFNVTVEVICADNSIKTVKVTGKMDCPIDCQPTCLTEFYSEAVNPYNTGLEGNWRPYKSFKYLDTRNYTSTRPDVRNDGMYTNFVPYWTLNSSSKYVANITNSNKWVKSSEVTKYSPFGNEMEDKDALDKYSAALFGHNFTLPIATSNNSKLEQIAYDGFEDYPQNILMISYPCQPVHWNFSQSLTNGVELSTEIKHTGNYSIKIPSASNAELIRPLVIADNSQTSFDEAKVRVLRTNDDLGIFKPSAGKYILSAWTKESDDPYSTTYSSPQIIITFRDNNGNIISPTYTFSPQDKIIEGWQRISAEFEVPAGAVDMRVKLNNSGQADVWFDDIRVQPFDGSMKTYAYDYRSSKLMAELDENNYATFYEYDQEGTLIRVKKETIDGIVTLKEARNHYFKK